MVIPRSPPPKPRARVDKPCTATITQLPPLPTSSPKVLWASGVSGRALVVISDQGGSIGSIKERQLYSFVDGTSSSYSLLTRVPPGPNPGFAALGDGFIMRIDRATVEERRQGKSRLQIEMINPQGKLTGTVHTYPPPLLNGLMASTGDKLIFARKEGHGMMALYSWRPGRIPSKIWAGPGAIGVGALFADEQQIALCAYNMEAAPNSSAIDWFKGRKAVAHVFDTGGRPKDDPAVILDEGKCVAPACAGGACLFSAVKVNKNFQTGGGYKINTAMAMLLYKNGIPRRIPFSGFPVSLTQKAFLVESLTGYDIRGLRAGSWLGIFIPNNKTAYLYSPPTPAGSSKWSELHLLFANPGAYAVGGLHDFSVYALWRQGVSFNGPSNLNKVTVRCE